MMIHGIMLNIEQLIRKSHGPLKMKDLPGQYLQIYRNELDSEDFGYSNLEGLLLTMTDKLEVTHSHDIHPMKFSFFFKFQYTESDLAISVKEFNSNLFQLAKNVVLTLMLAQCQLSFWQLKQDLIVRFKQDITLNICRNELRDYVEV